MGLNSVSLEVGHPQYLLAPLELYVDDFTCLDTLTARITFNGSYSYDVAPDSVSWLPPYPVGVVESHCLELE